MKVMRKERIIAKDHGDYVKAERNVLTAVFHPYIVTLRCSFQVRQCCCSPQLNGDVQMCKLLMHKTASV